jgi:hypothetical protein
MLFKYFEPIIKIVAISVFVFGVTSRVIGLFYYTQFLGDQVRDQGVYVGISEGRLPFLGPSSSIGGYSIPPLYYYLSNIFAFWNPANPSLAIISNTILSILSILAGCYLIYLMTDHLENKRRIWVSGIFGSLWSVFYLDIIHNSQEWNPSALNFFFFAFVIIFYFIFQNNLNNFSRFALWVLQGLNLAILISLHSSALFVFPLVFLVLIFVFLRSNLKFWYLPFVSILTFLTSLTLYWIGESESNFYNSKTILATIFDRSKPTKGVLEKFFNITKEFGIFGDQAYFHTINQPVVFLAIVSISILLISLNYKITKNLAVRIYFLCTIVFFIALSNYDGFVYQHYMVIVWSLGFILPILAVSTESKNLSLKVLKIPLYFFLISVFLFNTSAVIVLLQTKASAKRIPNTGDFAEIISKLPNNAKLCSEENQVPVFDFFAKTQSKNIQVSVNDPQCQFQYYPKFKANQKPNNDIPNRKSKIFFESETIVILVLS